MIPKGLRVKIPTSVDKTDYGQRLKNWSEKRVLRRAISDRTEKEIADVNLYLMQNLNMPRGWTDRMGRWVYNSLKETRQKIRKRLQLKLENLRKAEKEKRKVSQGGKMGSAKRKVVYNNSSKKLTEEQLEVLALGLDFGRTPKEVFIG